MSASVDYDVIIVGAGLSGIGAAYRIMTECPTKSFTVLEAREAIGGTWDLFRYPGVRSDSDMFTLGYPFHPWKAAKAIADGASILDYIRETSTKFGIDPHIRFRHRIVRASWSTDACRWTVELEVGEAKERKTLTCKFLYLCAGYYDYEKAHDPGFTGIDQFRGRVVHPQWWPENLDYADKRVIVIGSGATAVTLVPALAEKAAHVTMLQRSPTYITSLPASDAIADRIRSVLPARAAHGVVRTKNVLLNLGFYQFCRRSPKLARRLIEKQVRSLLPKDFPAEHFSPKYDPWDQRLCLVPDADLFKPLRSGKADVVTDKIETFTESGIRLASGRELVADIVVTATGLRIKPVGGVQFVVDGKTISAKDLLVYKGLMFSGIPNLAWCVGYTNASWTLRADLTSRYVCRLLNEMDKRGYDLAVPTARPGDDAETRPLLDLTSGYVARAASELPRQGSKAPWYLRQNYVLDFLSMTLGRVDDSMKFAKQRAA